MLNWRGVPYSLGKILLESGDWMSRFRELRHADLLELSEYYLQRMLRHACQHVPFYRDLEGCPLSEFPIRSKPDLHAARERHLQNDWMHHPWLAVQTSGSTGDTLEALLDPSVLAWNEASDMWYYATFLATPPLKYLRASRLYIWHQRQDPAAVGSNWSRLKRFLSPIRWLDPFEALSERTLIEYGVQMSRVRPQYVWGYPGVLYELACMAQQGRVSLPKPRFIISSGETLHPFMRPVIEEAFGCRTYDYYGAAEVGRVAAECSEGNLHVFTFTCHAELLDDAGRPVLPGEKGRLVLTALHNHVMPFIRYEIADWAEAGPSACPCGSPLPAIRRIAGRTVEFFVTREGNLVSGGRISQWVRTCPWVMSFQILQRDIDEVCIFFYRGTDSEVSQQDMLRVNGQIEAILGTSCHISWQEVDEIPRTAGGKRPYARSLVWESRQPDTLWEEAAD